MFNQEDVKLITSDKTNNFSSTDNYIWHSDFMRTAELIEYCVASNPIFTLSMELVNIIHSNDDISNNYEKMNNNHLIYSPISKSHEWKLEDFNVDELEFTTILHSKPFNIDGLDFMLECYKEHGDHRTDDYIALVLHLLNLLLLYYFYV